MVPPRCFGHVNGSDRRGVADERHRGGEVVKSGRASDRRGMEVKEKDLEMSKEIFKGRSFLFNVHDTCVSYRVLCYFLSKQPDKPNQISRQKVDMNTDAMRYSYL